MLTEPTVPLRTWDEAAAAFKQSVFVHCQGMHCHV